MQNCEQEGGKGRKGLKRPKSAAFILYSICLFTSQKGTGVGNYDGFLKILLMTGFVVAKGT